VIALIIVVVLLALLSGALAGALIRNRAAGRQTHEQLDAARAESAQTTAELDTARGELADARGQAKSARDEAQAAQDEARAQRGEAAGARAAADAARAELAAIQESSAGGSGGSGAAEAAAGAGVSGGASVATRTGAEDPGLDSGPQTGATLAALWSLARIRQEWLSRQVASLTLEGGHPEGAWAEVTLAEVLDEEVSRIREETGTPGALRTSLHDEPPAGRSMLLLAGVQALLEALARHCQAYDLYVHLWEERLTAIVVCEGFDGPDRVASDTEAVLSALAPAGGELTLDRDQQGRLRARLSIPLHSPA